MPQSFVCVNCHVVFSTKNREPLITAALAPRLYQYIGGIARQTGSPLVSAGGTADHLHLLLSFGRERTIADTVRDIKANSSRWIHDEFADLRGFAWQAGYGAFAVSYSNVEDVKQYIADQQRHHRVRTFQEEYVAMLERHNIEYDPRYIWS